MVVDILTKYVEACVLIVGRETQWRGEKNR